MAKWGEGDPRWVVQQRDDGKNVGGWHWQERNRMQWAKQRLPELLVGVCAAEEEGNGAGACSAAVVSVKSVTGEAMLTTRKQRKKFAMYDLRITLAWEGVLGGGAQQAAATTADDGGAKAGGQGEEGGASDAAAQGGAADARCRGELIITEFASGSDADDVEFEITLADEGEEQRRCKRLVSSALRREVLERLQQFVVELSMEDEEEC